MLVKNIGKHIGQTLLWAIVVAGLPAVMVVAAAGRRQWFGPEGAQPRCLYRHNPLSITAAFDAQTAGKPVVADQNWMVAAAQSAMLVKAGADVAGKGGTAADALAPSKRLLGLG